MRGGNKRAKLIISILGVGYCLIFGIPVCNREYFSD
jgi:hypothetical protein